MRKLLIILNSLLILVIAIFLLMPKSWLTIGDILVEKEKNCLMDSINTRYYSNVLDKESIMFYFDPECNICSTLLFKHKQKIVTSYQYRFMFVSCRDSMASVNEIKKCIGSISFKYILDKNKAIANRLQIDNYPTMITCKIAKKEYRIFRGAETINFFFNGIK
jgi:hypothetical protein